MELTVGPVELVQVGIAPLGGVIAKAIAPVGWGAPIVAAPVIVAVRTLTPPAVGLAEALKVIVGAWALKVAAVEMAEAMV